MAIPGSPAPRKPRTGIMGLLLGLGLVLYILVGAACAGFLLYAAYEAGTLGGGQPTLTSSTGAGLDEFTKLAIAALIGVIGTGFTGLAAIYGALRQSSAASNVAEFNSEVTHHLANLNTAANIALTEMKGDLDKSLAQIRSASEESLTRLKIALDATQIANRQLYGTATIYFHTLRTIALSGWDEESLKTAQSGMVAATPHSLHVDDRLRDLWYDIWQRGEVIARAAADHPAITDRPAIIRRMFDEKVATRAGKIHFRRLHFKLEQTARDAISSAT